jgi:copper chaperone CopZ
MIDRFNAMTGSSARRSEVHPATGGTASAAATRAAPFRTGRNRLHEQHTTYSLAGMTCGSCVASVTEEVSEIPGVENVQLDLASGAVAVTSKTWQNGQTVTWHSGQTRGTPPTSPGPRPPQRRRCAFRRRRRGHHPSR